MTKKTRSKTTITKEIIKEVKKLKKLARQGFSNVMISQATGIARQTLSTNRELKDNIQKGRLELAGEISSSIMATLHEDNAMKQLLVKRLGLFNSHIDIKAPKDAKDALNNLSKAIKQYANGEISESQLKTIEATANSYIKGYDATELEERLTRLEKIIQEKDK